jgi:hypothetical protein
VQFWEELIRNACSTVAEPDWLIEAVLVDQHFKHLTEVQRDNLLTLAYRIANEYGVAARPEPDGDALAIWFGRPERKEGAMGAIRLAYVRPALQSDGVEDVVSNG